MTPAPLTNTPDLVITRQLAAPPALVWKMFSDPYHLARWWGPKGFTNRVEHLDVRTGGKWRQVMIAPDGTELPLDYSFLEVTPPSRLVYRNAPGDAAVFGDNPPPSFTTEITLAAAGTGTLLTVRALFDSAADREAVSQRGYADGMGQSLDKMADTLAYAQSRRANRVDAPAGANLFTIERVFAAPRRLIYACYTRPEHMAHFWGPHGSQLAECRIDLRVGGVWWVRWVFPDGRGWGYASVYLHIDPDRTLHYRDAPADWAGGLYGLPPVELDSTITLADEGDGTRVTVKVICASPIARDTAIANGFINMVGTGNDRLAAYLDTNPSLG